jgi:hypothetical protein
MGWIVLSVSKLPTVQHSGIDSALPLWMSTLPIGAEAAIGGWTLFPGRRERIAAVVSLLASTLLLALAFSTSARECGCLGVFGSGSTWQKVAIAASLAYVSIDWLLTPGSTVSHAEP